MTATGTQKTVIDPARFLCTEAARGLSAHLDATPSDQAARLLLADVLEEAGDPWACGLRRMAAEGKWPEPSTQPQGLVWEWWEAKDVGAGRRCHAPVPKWHELDHFGANMPGMEKVYPYYYCRYPTRRHAEAALCEWYARHPEDGR